VAQSGNGADIGAVYQLLSEVAQTVRAHGEELVQVNRNLGDLRRDVADLRVTVTEYHSTVVGHGILYGELEQRIRRIERHLKLEPTGA